MHKNDINTVKLNTHKNIKNILHSSIYRRPESVFFTFTNEMQKYHTPIVCIHHSLIKPSTSDHLVHCIQKKWNVHHLND